MKHIKTVSKASVDDVSAAVQECITSILEAAGLDEIVSLVKKGDDTT